MSKEFKLLGLIIITIFCIAPFTFISVNASEDIVEDAKNKSSYTTVEVVKGDYIEKGAVMDAELTFLRSDGIAIKEGEGTFIEYLVNNGQSVLEGDALLSYSVWYDYIAVEEKKFALEQAIKSYEADLGRREAEIAENISIWQNMDQTTIDAQSFRLKITKLEVGYDQFKFQGEKNIKAMQESIDDMESNAEIKYLYAPYDGIVITDDKIVEDTSINQYMELLRIYDTKSAVLAASAAKANKLWYNQEVSVTMISSKQENRGTSYKGKVISTDSVLDNKASTGRIFIKLEDESLYSTISKANITADAIYLQDVFLIPLKAVHFNNEERYIYYLDDSGDMHKQYITGRHNGVDMWVYDGLTVGQKIVVD